MPSQGYYGLLGSPADNNIKTTMISCHTIPFVPSVGKYHLLIFLMEMATIDVMLVKTITDKKVYNHWPLLLTWFNFNPSMDK